MSLMDAPSYDPTTDNLKRSALIGSLAAVLLACLIGFGGFAAGHGWFFSNLGAEHKVDHFFAALQQKDYGAAYSIYTNGHPDSDYPLARFTEDWTTYSPVKSPITTYHVDVSRVDGTGSGSTVIVGVTVNGSKRVFVNVLKSDGTLTCCSATHEIQY